MSVTTGRLIGIAVREKPYATMITRDRTELSIEAGLAGDHKGAKFPKRQVTILAREAWDDVCAELSDLAGPVPLPWTARRANLLIDGLRLPRARGAILTVGSVRLEVTAQTYPCARMDQAHRGLLRALAPDWRGGVTCRVLAGGEIALGNPIEIAHAPAEHVARLPG
jgi:MOSC domain-containing protein YiiM